ncbi:MAG: hypothetical protein N2445_09405, partial [Acidobacteria bacterium]|nr:hypothetical protein [Acidobacteriota bacterium]
MKKILCFFALIVLWLSVSGQAVERIESAAGCGIKLKKEGKGTARGKDKLKLSEEGNYFGSASRDPEAVDATTLFVDKSSDGSVVYLSWNEDDSPFVVSRSADPSFQKEVEVLEKDISAGGMQILARTNKTLECYDVSGGSVVSYPSQGIGYDPDPAPSVPTIAGNVLWWGDNFQIWSNYLEPFAKGNVIQMGD